VTTARIHESGYRPYQGDRLGVSSAMISLFVHGIQRVLGLKRRLGAKVLPAATIGFAYIPAVVFVGLAAFLPEDLIEEGVLPDYYEYYGFVTLAILLFTSFVAPEVLCTDRRTGMLSLYLASPLTRDTYLLAKAASVISVLLAVTLGPLLLLLIAYTFEGAGPGSLDDFLILLGRILAAGVTVAMMWTALSLAVSSITSRKAFASAAIIVILLSTRTVAEILAGGDPDDLDFPAWIGVFDLFLLPFELSTRIFGESNIEPGSTQAVNQMHTGLVWLANLGWTALFAGFTRWRYQYLDVDR
jgi:ABC-2 type transport system permease protein